MNLGTDRLDFHGVASSAQPARANVSERAWVTRVCRVVVVCATAVAAVAVAQSPPQAANTLRVHGNVERELTLGVSDLQGLAVQRVEDVRQIRVAGATGQPGEQKRSYAGVLLRDVLTLARPVEKQRHDLRRSIVVVTATDGYQAVFSWAELFLSPIGDGALVIFERDGAPLPENEGPLALVSLRDTQPGPRHVKWLRKVELRRVAD
jgi:DMSO/TMAO reductase YedYZ molybdopterin-dependent catalytic subunit